LLRGALPPAENELLQSVFMGACLAGLVKAHHVKIMRAGTIYAVRGVRADAGEVVTLGTLLKEWLRGRTVAINHIYRYERRLAALCSTALKSWGRLLHLNAYWTPPSSRGAGRHSDEHDVLILQCHGSKTWSVWQGRKREEMQVGAGDILFLRAGVEHDPGTEMSSSFHVTLGVSRQQERPSPGEALKTFAEPRDSAASFIADPNSHFDACNALCSAGGAKRKWLWRVEVDVAQREQDLIFDTAWGARNQLSLQLLSDTFQREPAPGAELLFRSGVRSAIRDDWIRLLVSRGLVRLCDT
jgi:hypothetical protein